MYIFDYNLNFEAILPSIYPKPNYMRKVIFCLSAVFLLIFSSTLLLFTGCQKELSGSVTNNLPDIDMEKVNAGIRGIVVDENNQPVMGATVTSGVNTTSTDRMVFFDLIISAFPKLMDM